MSVKTQHVDDQSGKTIRADALRYMIIEVHPDGHVGVLEKEFGTLATLGTFARASYKNKEILSFVDSDLSLEPMVLQTPLPEDEPAKE